MRRLALLLVAVVILGGVGFAATFAGIRLARSVPPPLVQVDPGPSTVLVADPAPPIPLPTSGSLAVRTDRDGTLASLAADTPRPIGSVAKTMTALQVLTDEPLAPGAEGPIHVIDRADVDDLARTLAADGSSAPVVLGERFTERQLLLGLMLPSANNLAETLARVAGGDRPTFLAQLNAHAAALGMHATHFDDPSGYSPATVSSASDLLLLGEAALQNPALAAIVATTEATLPDGTVVHNIDGLLGTAPGWLGIKTGETPQAGACLLFAARRVVGGSGATVTVVGAVLGQPVLTDAFHVATTTVDATAAGYVEVDPRLAPPNLHGSVAAAWGPRTSVAPGRAEGEPFVTRRPVVIDWVRDASSAPAQGPGLDAGTPVATVRGELRGRLVVTFAVDTVRAISAPTLRWRLTHD